MQDGWSRTAAWVRCIAKLATVEALFSYPGRAARDEYVAGSNA
jgi:hypothetical protein